MKKLIVILLFSYSLGVMAGDHSAMRENRGRGERNCRESDRMSGLALAAGIVGLTANTLEILSPRPVIVTSPAYSQPQIYTTYAASTYAQPVVVQQPIYINPSPVYVPVAPVTSYVPRGISPISMRPLPPRPVFRR